MTNVCEVDAGYKVLTPFLIAIGTSKSAFLSGEDVGTDSSLPFEFSSEFVTETDDWSC